MVAVAVGGSRLASDAEKQGKGGGVSVLLAHSGKAGGSGEDLALILFSIAAEPLVRERRREQVAAVSSCRAACSWVLATGSSGFPFKPRIARRWRFWDRLLSSWPHLTPEQSLWLVLSLPHSPHYPSVSLIFPEGIASESRHPVSRPCPVI